MLKMIGIVFGSALLLTLSDHPVRSDFAKFKAVEAYEVRPGILMIPTYSADGQLCEIGLEKLHYSPEVIHLDSTLSRKDIDQIFGELVPSEERGPRPASLLQRGMTTFSGHGMVTDEEYQNVSIRIFGSISEVGETKTPDEVAATLNWKGRKCK